MIPYHYPAQPSTHGLARVVGPPQSALRWLALDRLILETEGDQCAVSTGPDEAGIDVCSGTAEVALRGEWGKVTYPSVGQRSSPFAGVPSMVYIPRNTELIITSLAGPLTALLVRSPSRRDTLPCLIGPDQVVTEAFGRDNWQRQVHVCIGMNVDADRIVMGETHTPSGNWSSYPPHKHDIDSGSERAAEEIYHFRIDPPHGFGMQYLWTAPGHPELPIHEAYSLRDGDTVAIPRGYHPTVVAPGFRLVTVWAFAGEARSWRCWSVEPRYGELLEEPGLAGT
jgi:5-deoxy-glucuronate isomerase